MARESQRRRLQQCRVITRYDTLTLRHKRTLVKATVMYGAGDVRIETVPYPRITEPSDAIVRITRSCICARDLWPYKEMKAGDPPRRMGHEFIGIIEDIGAGVRSLKRGDLVVAPFAISDGTCDF